MNESELQLLDIAGLTVKVQAPDGAGPYPVLLLLHGWTGDEDSMWAFRSALPDDALLIAPRGLYPSPQGGFTWHGPHAGRRSWVDDYRPAVDVLLELLTPENFPQAAFGPTGPADLRLVGFSQGAALAFSFAFLHPGLVRAVAGLAGYLPEGAAALARNRPLEGKPVFLAHGTQDEMIPVANAREAVGILEDAGARVTYCEDEVGHKLGINCFRGLETFLRH